MSIKPLEIRRVTAYPIWHARYADQATLAMAFVRMSEYGECPQFRGQVFSLEEFSSWYSQKYGRGKFTYPQDWTGFNVTSASVLAVRDRFSGHHPEERALLDSLESAGVFQQRRFCLIGTSDDTDLGDSKDSVFAHELRHGLFFCCPDYRRRVKAAVRRFGNRRLRRRLIRTGYDQSVLTDEIQAYALTGWPSDHKPTKEDLALRSALEEIEKEFI